MGSSAAPPSRAASTPGVSRAAATSAVVQHSAPAFRMGMNKAGFARALLSWYGEHRRDLPWRREPSPYRTLVSELMLQQTVVATVVPYFERFVARFPTIQALAAARQEDVLAAW